jgi:RHS repeat-associated protein
VAVGRNGSLYIASGENGEDRIRKVGPDGIIETVAGGGASSADGIVATDAYIGGIRSIALGLDGSLYFADAYPHHRVRRVGTDGIVSTVAGSDGSGSNGDGGPATAARLFDPKGITFGRDGSLYIADYGNDRIRKVTSDGIITTVAGGGTLEEDGSPAAGAFLDGPRGVAFAPNELMFVSEYWDFAVLQLGTPLPGYSVDGLRIVSADGTEVYEFAVDGRHLRTRHALTDAVKLEFSYDAEGRLSSVVDGSGNVTTIDWSSNPILVIAPDGQTTELTLDGEGYLASVDDPAGATTSFAYTSDGLMTELTDVRDNTWTFTYDADGRLLRDDDPAGGYKELERVATADGYQVVLTTGVSAVPFEERSRIYEVRSLPNDLKERVTTQPDGTETEVVIGPSGTSTTTFANGVIQQVQQSPAPRFGMLAPLSDTQIATPGGLTLTVSEQRSILSLDPLEFVSMTVINGRTFTRAFNEGTPFSTETTVSDEGREVTTMLDEQQRVVRSEVPGLHPIRREYDGRGRLTKIKHGPEPDGEDTRITTFTYKENAGDQTGLLDEIIDATEREIQFEYDDAGRVTTQTFLPGTVDERQIVYAYDENGNLTSITPPGKTVAHTFDYTEVNLESEYVPPDPTPAIPMPETNYSYNLARQLTQIIRPDGQTVDFGYEATEGRLQAVTLQPSSETRTYSYDAAGRLSALTGPDADLSFTYDGALLTQEQWTDGPVVSSVTRTYDNDFRIQALQVNSETLVSFTYDGDSLLTAAGALAPITRHPDDGSVTDTAIGLVTDIRTYSSFGELASYQASIDGTPAYSVGYTRDKLGRITEKTETIETEGPTVTEYRYDAAGRLEEVEVGTDIVSYTYDQNGNRLARELNSVVQESGTYDDQDRLLTYGTASYTYNDNGDLIEKNDGGDVTTYTYDALGNLRSVDLPDGTTITYQIDGRNRRIGRIEDDGVTTVVQRFVYKDQLNPVAELDESGNLVAQFVYGTKPNVPDYMIKYGTDAGMYRILSDHLGSVRLVTNVSDGTIMQRIDYDEFGVVLQDTNPGFQPFGFAGGIYDTHTGLVRFGARDYDPSVGRWTTKDPIGFDGDGPNLYTYAFGNPIHFRDPSGLGSTGSIVFDIIEAFEDLLRRRDDLANVVRPFWERGEEGLLTTEDQFFHCLAHCEVLRSHGTGGEITSQVGGIVNEVLDTLGVGRGRPGAGRAAGSEGVL